MSVTLIALGAGLLFAATACSDDGSDSPVDSKPADGGNDAGSNDVFGYDQYVPSDIGRRFQDIIDGGNVDAGDAVELPMDSSTGVVDISVPDTSQPDAADFEPDLPDTTTSPDIVAPPDVDDSPETGPDIKDIKEEINQCVPTEEVCNGIDDNCNGKADEGFDVGLLCKSDEEDNPCTTTVPKVCAPDGLSTICPAKPDMTKKTDETCLNMNVDNDCDGVKDNISDLDKVCQAGLGICMNQGKRVCMPSSPYPQCNVESDISKKTSETCKNMGEDNDCNGKIDDDIPGIGLGCFVGAGICLGKGTQECDAATGELKCNAKEDISKKTTEVCNGKDDDCDGIADNDPLEVKASNQFGICLGSVMMCVDGKLIEPDKAKVEGYEPVEKTCDDKDNNCDGKTDEGLPDMDEDGVCNDIDSAINNITNGYLMLYGYDADKQLSKEDLVKKLLAIPANKNVAISLEFYKKGTPVSDKGVQLCYHNDDLQGQKVPRCKNKEPAPIAKANLLGLPGSVININMWPVMAGAELVASFLAKKIATKPNYAMGLTIEIPTKDPKCYYLFNTYSCSN